MTGEAIPADDLRRAALEFSAASKESEAIRLRLREVFEDLEKSWTGPTREAFLRNYRAWEGQMVSTGQHLLMLARQLDALAERFSRADRP